MTTDPSLEVVERLRKLRAQATPGPYRAHDHTRFDKPDEWVGYAWVGRITKDSGPDGSFDAGWADLDRRNDGCKEYRERASVDAQFIAETLNALPDLLATIERLSAERMQLREAAQAAFDLLIESRRGNGKGMTNAEALLRAALSNTAENG